MIKRPSLVINITDRCNFKCKYCPPYGENLSVSNIEYDLDAVKSLIDLAAENDVKLIRFTGGEPLLEFDRLYELLSYTGKRFPRTVLNTNGYYLMDKLKNLEKFKDFLTIKVSLDSLDYSESTFISGVNSKSTVIDSIIKATDEGFSTEINTVFCSQSVESIIKIIEFARNLSIDMKILTASDFYGKVKVVDNRGELCRLIQSIEKSLQKKEDEKLATGMGVSMLCYKNGDKSLLIIDHSNIDSFTPKKMYFSDCDTICSAFPCEFGVLSVTVSTDGILTPCRGRKDFGKCIFGKTKKEIISIYNDCLSYFHDCCEVNVNDM